jgi:hypothetical protein
MYNVNRPSLNIPPVNHLVETESYNLQKFCHRQTYEDVSVYQRHRRCVEERIWRQIVEPVKKIERHGVVKENSSKKVVIGHKIPASFLDWLKHVLPDNMKFGWLIPVYEAVEITNINTEHYTINKLEATHYHRVIVPDGDVAKHVDSLTVHKAYSLPYHRVAISGYETRDLIRNIRETMDKMREYNGCPVLKIVLNRKDYYTLVSKTDNYEWLKFSVFEGDDNTIFGVPFEVVSPTEVPFSYIEA